MKIHSMQQGSTEWEKFRLQHFGASEAAAMLGISSKTTRNELLRMKSTGIAKEFSDWVQKFILDYGHEVEETARPLVEAMIGEELYPVTCSDGRISASCDGLTMLEDIAFEHKQMNSALSESISNGVLPDEYMPQCQQIMMVTGAQKVIFVCSDGTQENFFHMDVLPDQNWFDRLRAGWAQFEKDLDAYEHVEAKPLVTGQPPESLPALRIEVSGQVTASNLAEFKARAIQVFDGINTNLQTDEDFATADKTAKWCKDVEERLESAKQHALSQTASIDDLFRAIDEIKDQARKKRLTLEKSVKQEKDRIRVEMVENANKLFSKHIKSLQDDINSVRQGVLFDFRSPAFGLDIKGLKTISSIQNALNTAIANAKIESSEQARRICEKLAWFNENPDESLFQDLKYLIDKPMDDFSLLVSSRIDMAKKSEAERAQKAEAAKKTVLDHQQEIGLFLKTRDFGKEENKIRAVLVEFVKFQNSLKEVKQ